jgi:CheY-specific phosphatase CheX
MMDIDHEIGHVFTDAMLEIISITAGHYHEVLSDGKDNAFDEMTCVMNLNGKKTGLLFLSAKEADMRTLCSCMIGVPQVELTKHEVEDALCELMNMTAGNAKLRLGNTGYVFNLSTPLLIHGRDMSVVTKKRTRVISRTVGNGELSVKLKVVY